MTSKTLPTGQALSLGNASFSRDGSLSFSDIAAKLSPAYDAQTVAWFAQGYFEGRRGFIGHPADDHRNFLGA